MKKRFSALSLYVFLGFSQPTSGFEIASGMATGAVLQGILSELDASIDQAFSQGNYTVWNAGAQARLTLDRWGEVNKELLDISFDELSNQQRLFFRNINDLAGEMDSKARDLSSRANEIIDRTQQIIADVKFWDSQPVAIRYSPSLINWGRSTEKVITVNGVNLDKSDPELLLNIGDQSVNLERISLTQNFVKFRIDPELLSPDTNKTKLVSGELKLTHTNQKFFGLFNSEKVFIRSRLAFGLLPQHMGEVVSLEVFKKTKDRLYTDWKSREFHFSSGSLTEKCDVQVQNPALDHKVDPDTLEIWHNRPNPHPRAGQNIQINTGGLLGRLLVPVPATLPGVWGKAGSQRVESKSTEGFAIRVCAKRWSCCVPPDTGPGNQHVVYRWKEFKSVEEIRKVTYPGGLINWNKDTLFKVDSDMDGLILKLRLFTGEERVEIRERLGSGRIYAVEFEPKTGVVLVRPQIPPDLAAISN